MIPKYKLYVRDSNFNRIAEIDDYTKLELLINFNGVGTWTLDIPTQSNASFLLAQPQSGIIVVREEQTLFSGPMGIVDRKWTKDSDTMEISGFDDNFWLTRFLAYPVPSGPPYTSQAYDIRSGAAETVIKAYLNANIGASAQTQRKINIVTAADQARGLNVTGNARFQTLLELFAPLALTGGDIGFNITQDNNQLLFDCYIPTDKSNSVIFSPLLGNMIDFEYKNAAPSENYIIAGGTGDGTARIFSEFGDSNSISQWGRYEFFLDDTNSSSVDSLNQAIQNNLSQRALQTSLSITPTDTDATKFGRDYNLGDIVSVVLTQPDQNGNQIPFDTVTDVIRQIKITIDNTGESISPVIGTPDSLSHIPSIVSKMKRLDRRIVNLERT